ncbi:YadA-like family protein [Klebsiella pneumoniae]|nr:MULTISPECIES: YadA-like family protein [Enterobacterales]QUY35190.1 YadA-like family protein [Klebsiella pneumoniae]WOS22912.1 YadA-like family protein [Proteus mirabilis]WOS26738.1 YadA-like family protein [Proteus mirabilis]
MKTAKYNLVVLAAAVSLSLFSSVSFAKDGETKDKNFYPEMLEGKNGQRPQGLWCEGSGKCRDDAITWVYGKVKEVSPEKINAAKNEAINAGQNAANKAEANANASTDKKISGAKNELNNSINNAKNEAVSAGKTAADAAEKNANSYTDKKVAESNSRTDGLISKEQKAREDAIHAEKSAREQGDKDTLNKANQYTDSKIAENNTVINQNIQNQSELDREYTDKKAKEAENAASTHADKQAKQAEKNANTYTDSKLTEAKSELNTSIGNAKNEAVKAGQNAADNAEASANKYTDFKIQENNELLSADIAQSREEFNHGITTTENKLTENLDRTKKDLSDNLDKTRGDLSANIIASQQDSNNRTDRLIAKEQKDRDTAVKAEEQARIQGDKDTLNSANNYTDHRIDSLGANVGDAMSNFRQETNQRFGQLDNKIDRVEKRANAGIAGVTAISSIPYVAEDTFSFGMALGHYRNSQAVATGIQYKPSPNTNVRLNASWNNGGDSNLGAGFALGW